MLMYLVIFMGIIVKQISSNSKRLYKTHDSVDLSLNYGELLVKLYEITSYRFSLELIR
jgi:hypothetical protein